jgi:predicted nucleotidyltransferase
MVNLIQINEINLNVDYIRTIKEHLRDQPIKKAYLFGSFARNEQDSSSDIDLMVELDSNVGVFRLVSIQLMLEQALKRKVDLISSRGISKHILPIIEKEKILIYER